MPVLSEVEGSKGHGRGQEEGPPATAEGLLSAAPPFDEPVAPRTKDELARWLAWQRWRHGGQASPMRFYRQLLRERKAELVRRHRAWQHQQENC